MRELIAADSMAVHLADHANSPPVSRISLPWVTNDGTTINNNEHP